jgi:hypothetical protein
MYQEKDTPPQTGIFFLVTQQMLEEHKRNQNPSMTKLDKMIALFLVVLFLLIVKQWS